MKKKGFKRVILPGILLFLAIKTHTIGILYVPAWIFLVLSSGGQIQAKFTWKKAFIFIFVPFVLAGLVVYFFILRDHMDPRFLDGNTPVGERLFLPMFSPSPPLDRYNLFSWNHILDYFNIWLFLSPGAIAMILYLFMARPEGKKLQDPALILTGTTFALFLIFFFGINPLLGMPMDWDLFSLIFPVMISFLIVLTSKLNLVSQSLTPVMPVLAISLLGFLFLPLNASKSKTGERLQALGKHSFKTYWIHSAAVIFDGVQPWEDNPEEHYQRLSGITDDLLPWANEGNDIEFAELLRVQGRLCRRKLHQYDEAVKHQEQALTYAPDDPKFNLGLMEAYYLQGNLEEALKQARILIREGYPSQEEALRIGMDIALEGRRFEDALIFGREYTRSWQDNPAINKVVYLLRNNQRLDDLSRIFRGQME